FMGQARAILDAPASDDEATLPAPRSVAAPNAPGYARYRLTDDGVSPMAIPGTPGVTYTADGLEHTEAAIPSSQAGDHQAQLDKRARKLQSFDYGARWADIDGDGELAVITFGSASGPAREAVARAAAAGVAVKLIVLRLIAPLQSQRLAQALAGVRRAIVVEQNHGGQLYRYLRAFADGCPAELVGYHRPGPLPLRPGELYDRILREGMQR
ncbi:MAG TPA: hypothetical protein VM491_10050, partial [Burkholderiaceae bacterium]|nr:hypothetical protein [Burkholderiaceae bacterium]